MRVQLGRLAATLFLLVGAGAGQAANVNAGCSEFPSAKAVSDYDSMMKLEGTSGSTHTAPKAHVDMPNGPIGSVRIVMKRTACFGTCPVYRVELQGDGSVLFDGDSYTAVQGVHRLQVTQAAVQCLLDNFRSADFWSADPEYSARVSDLPSAEISLTINGETKTVRDYGGAMIGMPRLVWALEQAIDDTAETQTWIRGSHRTLAALASEQFDFRAQSAAEDLVRLTASAPESVVLGFLDGGAPIGVRARNGYNEMSAVETAAMFGRLPLLKAFIEKGAFAKGGKQLLNATLRASVASGDPDVIAEVLKHGPDVNSRDERGDTALALLFTGAHPFAGDDRPDRTVEIIRLLGQHGANPNLKTADGESLLELAYGKEEKDALISIGAR